MSIKRGKAVIYTRVSTDEQAKTGTSLNEQLAMCQAKAELRKETVTAVYEDAGVSGGLYWERKGLQQALNDLETGKAQTLIVASMTRLSRDRAHYSTIKQRVQLAGAQLIFCDAEYEDSAMGEFAENISNDFAHLERRIIKERTKKGRRRAAMERGVQTQSAFRPYGYYIPKTQDVMTGLYSLEQRGKYQIVEEEARWVREMFARVANGQSLHSLARWLNEQGLQTPRNGQYWRVSTIKRILNNPVYKGMAVHGRHERRHDYSLLEKEHKHGKCYTQPYLVRETPEEKWIYIEAPALVDEETWERCQSIITENRQRHGGRNDRKYTLSGLIRCPLCKRTMNATKRIKKRSPGQIANGHGRHPYLDYRYTCKDSRPSRNAGGVQCNPKHYSGTKAEKAIFSALDYAAHEPEAIGAALRAAREATANTFDENEYQRLTCELHELEQRETATVQAQIRGIQYGANVTIYETALRDIAGKRAKLEAALKEAEAQRAQCLTGNEVEEAQLIADALSAVTEVLNASDTKISDNEKRELIGRVVDTIYPEDCDTFAVNLKPFTKGALTVATISKL